MTENTTDVHRPQAAQTCPRVSLTPQQQLAATRRVQDQAEQRVKLGVQLFKAAEAHVANHQELVDGVRTEQKQLQQRLQEDVARSLHQYDQWVTQVDEGLTNRLHELEGKLDQLQRQWTETEKRIDGLMRRAETMFDQSRSLLQTAAPQTRRVHVATAAKPDPAAPHDNARPAERLKHKTPRSLPPHDPIYLNLVRKMRDSAA